MHHLTYGQFQHLRQELKQQKQELEQQLRNNDHFGRMDALREITGDSSIDNHPADQGTEDFERAKDTALNERTERAIERIGQALNRMKTGEYGICETCGKPIPYERLEVIPYTQYCIEHSPNQSVSNNRPAEEQVLRRPFGRTSLDEHEDTQFDGEDAWQTVERWGSSNSPAFAEDRAVDDYDELMIESGEPDGFVQPIESFVATDLYGQSASVVRNRTYHWYMETDQGDRTLESGTDGEQWAGI